MSSKTGIGPEKSVEQIKSPKRTKKKKRKKDPFLKIAGVKKVTLSEFTQKLIGCIAGQHVTIDNPWMFVNKDQIIDNIEFHEGSSEFLAVAADIKKYRDKKIYMGYVPDDSKDEDDFYICTVEESIPKIIELAAKLRQEIDERMYNALYKTIREWRSLGSEVEVEQARFKNNRPLIEVEIEAGYPISPMRKEFDINRAQDRRDGYMELKLNPEERRVCVYKRRIDAYVQQAPQFRTIHVQTTCTYPANASTQYLYEIGDTVPLLAACAKPFKTYVHDNLDYITDMLSVNGKLNLYSEDYLSLIKNNAKFVSATVVEEVKEYMSFMDVDLCKEKMISDVVFHPMWTGTVAVAYNTVAPFTYQSGPSSQVAKTIHGSNIVLIWSCLDGLKPKLILNSPREVIKLAFCKFDENVLIGGLRNGQISIWDLRNKLQQVEDSQILSPFQVKNRASMKSLMAWMKIVHDVAVVEPAAVSDVKYSHKGPVTGINWVSPFYEFTKLGRLTEIEDDADSPYSMQFLTGAEDGTVLIWDLMKLPQVSQDGFKPRKLKRLKQKPAALVTDTSPHSVHNLTLRPIYRIIIPREKKKPMSLTSCHEDLCPMNYVELNQMKSKKPLPLNERIIYMPVMDKTLYPKIEPQVQLGSMEGDFYNCNWEGQDFDSGEIINTEFATVKSRAKVHDGPLNTTQKNHEFDVTLTVGGRIFAFWNKELPDRPLFWRKASLMYTSGEWNISQPYLFTNKLINGDVETWSVAFDSKNPSFSLTFSSGCLTASAFHTLKQRRTIYGAADKLGCLRLFFMPEDGTPGTLESKNKKFKDFIEREVLRKRMFLNWQSNWNAKAAQRYITQVDDLVSIAPVVETKVVEGEKEEKDVEEKPKEKKILKKDEETYVEKIIRRRKMDEEAIIKETIVAKKQLDTKELEKRRKPLLKLEEENIRKKKKQKQRLKEGENIFLDTVSSLFPDVMKEKPPPPPDAYASNWATKPLCEKTYSTFLDIKDDSTRFIQNHPYTYEFDWSKVLIVGKQRREFMTDPTGEKKQAWDKRGRTGKKSPPSHLVATHADETSSVKSVKSKIEQKLDGSDLAFL